nr:hypothetical protein [uncultured Roseateles sp.]
MNPPLKPPLKPSRTGDGPLGARDKERLLLPHLETLGELTGRMTRHTGLRGWWRKRFGPKPTVPGNEVLAMAQRIGVPLMQALQQRLGCGADIAERQLGVLLGEWFGQTFKSCRPASGKHWRQRVSHRGSGVFAEAWQLARSGCERSGRAPDGQAERRMKAVATMCVLNALHSAPLRS